MAFACQRNSYLKELTCKIVSCIKVKHGFEVTFNDTILFPEGGGQPTDQGWIGDVHVESVTRRGPEAIHIVAEEVKVGEDVLCKIDWDRRFDHMQQHSGQHLLSAIAEIKYGLRTVSWDLGKSISHVELNTPKLSAEVLQDIESTCNNHIRERKSVKVHYLTKNEALELPEVKSRGLPGDVLEPIRVIEIEGVEQNMCCGTHVSNLSDVQVIKLLHTEPMRGGTRVFFLVGDRVMKKLSSLSATERQLTKLLTCGADKHVETIDKMKTTLRVSQKSCRNYLKEIAQFEGDAMSQLMDQDGYIYKHREDGDMDYIFTLLKSIPDSCKDSLIFLCAGPVKTGGQFLLRGGEKYNMDEISKKICELIGGKGGGKKGQYQGKASSFKRLPEVIQLLNESK